MLVGNLTDIVILTPSGEDRRRDLQICHRGVQDEQGEQRRGIRCDSNSSYLIANCLTDVEHITCPNRERTGLFAGYLDCRRSTETWRHHWCGYASGRESHRHSHQSSHQPSHNCYSQCGRTLYVTRSSRSLPLECHAALPCE